MTIDPPDVCWRTEKSTGTRTGVFVVVTCALCMLRIRIVSCWVKSFSVLPFLGAIDNDVYHLPRRYHKGLHGEVAKIFGNKVGVLWFAHLHKPL